MGRHTLIPSTSIDESTRLLPLNIVTKKKKRTWIFFHKIEYSTYDFPVTGKHQKELGLLAC
jgi:hypothetical protein